jgi:hypothetical protein
MLKAGNVRLEMHESTIPSAETHEALGRICTTRYGWYAKARGS